MSKTERREVYYHGWVQGVGFRHTTTRTAERFAVTGFVENLPDGSVKLVVEGSAKEIDRFLAAIRGEFERHIRNIDIKHREATSEFAGFQIRH